eukprot:1155297-Pelagomonas_calceolata.AAC.4
MVLPDRQASPAICVVYTAALCVFNIACLCFQAGKQPCIQAFHIAAMEMGRYMDSLIADNKSKEAQEKRQKEEHQAAMNALYTSQGALFTSGSSLVTEHMQLRNVSICNCFTCARVHLRERAALQQAEDLQLKREVALERMRNAELERQDKEFRERQAILNREKNEAMKRHMDEVLRQQARERAREVEEERKATKEVWLEYELEGQRLYPRVSCSTSTCLLKQLRGWEVSAGTGYR